MDRKARLREYRATPRPAGLFVVRNIATGRTLVAASENLPGSLNRQRFQLELGSHPDKQLQAEWNELGPAGFAIEVLDEIEPLLEPSDLSADLEVLRLEWIERLAAEGVAFYPSSARGVRGGEA